MTLDAWARCMNGQVERRVRHQERERLRLRCAAAVRDRRFRRSLTAIQRTLDDIREGVADAR